jgi:hypothetical protein
MLQVGEAGMVEEEEEEEEEEDIATISRSRTTDSIVLF